MTVFGATLKVLLLGPPAAWLALLAARRLGRRPTRMLLTAAATLLAVIILASWLGIGFRDGTANLTAIGAAYLAYAVLAFAAPLLADRPALRRRPTALAVLVFAAFIPMAVGYLLGTVGALAMAFMVGDATDPPVLREARADGLVCEVHRQAGGPSDDGYHYGLYREASLLPLRWRVDDGPLELERVSPSAGGSGDSCAPGRRFPTAR
ncbi:hypothetical protein [Caulobacter endophyticus]|uniref:hypothetical protein n=1 Tax=Caulobacter endophyticus TaxID=2172652 RepID=UPI0024107183|nr:hypothetical protein [Caulobacter endophyticus]MDG2530796.1 hypothetical protein [Caulobacter endophyticus]